MPAAKPSKKADKSPSKRAAAAKAEPDAKRKRTQPKGEAAGGAQAPPPKAEAKAGDEIDDLFGKLKGSTSSIKKANKPEPPAEKPRKAAVAGSKDDIFGNQANTGRKRTEEGYLVYSEEELQVNTRGGDTALCPFDCECCY